MKGDVMGLNEGSHHCHHQGKHGADYGGHATLAPPSPSKPYFCPTYLAFPLPREFFIRSSDFC